MFCVVSYTLPVTSLLDSSHFTRADKSLPGRPERREVPARREPRLEAHAELLAAVVLQLFYMADHVPRIQFLFLPR